MVVAKFFQFYLVQLIGLLLFVWRKQHKYFNSSIVQLIETFRKNHIRHFQFYLVQLTDMGSLKFIFIQERFQFYLVQLTGWYDAKVDAALFSFNST